MRTFVSPLLCSEMDFAQLITFVEVAERGSFSRAADEVSRSQSAVSAQIQQLEKEYGERLFDRTKQSVKLTPAGELLLDYARRMLEMREESMRVVADSGNVTRGVLTIGANETTFLYVIPDLVARFHHANPKVRLSVYRNFSHKVVQKVEDGELELGVVTIPLKSSSLASVSLFRDPLVWIAAANSPIAQKATVKMSELAEQELILHKIGSLRRLMEKELKPFRPRLHVTMELSSTIMVKKFVAAGIGISLISESFVQAELREGRIKILKTDGEPCYRELGLAYHQGRSLSRAAQAFIEMAKTQAKATRA